MLGSPISRYSSRVLKTAPSQCVWGMIQKVSFFDPCAIGGGGSTPSEQQGGRRARRTKMSGTLADGRSALPFTGTAGMVPRGRLLSRLFSRQRGRLLAAGIGNRNRRRLAATAARLQSLPALRFSDLGQSCLAIAR